MEIMKMPEKNASDSASILPYTRVLVTGAAGFVGSRLLERLTATGCHVIALDDMSVGLPLPPMSALVTPILADIRNRNLIRAVFADHKPQAIVHLAALHHIPTCEAKPHLALDINVMGTQILLEEAAQGGTKDVILASSGAVYDWTDGALSEDQSPLRARDIYATTKLANEYQLFTWCDRTGGRGHVARLFNVVGLNDPNGHLIPDILKQLNQAGSGEAIIHLGNIKPKRDYIYVDDVASGLFTMLQGLAEGADQDIFNVCSGNELTVAELVYLLGDIMGVKVRIEQDPARMRKVDRLQQLGNPAKMKSCYGWSTQFDVRAALTVIAKGALGESAIQAAA
jgi:nucleoside-diphosphate-sugar epimerase